MTAEYERKPRQQPRDYAMLSYRLPYIGELGYAEDEEQGKQPQASGTEDVYGKKSACPQSQPNIEAISVTLVRYYVRLRKISG
jgi:hypothetical protein